MGFDGIWLVLGFAAFLAGFVDAVVGGGGLVQIPALFSALPSTFPATLLATNKVSSLVGTFSAAVQYARRVRVPLVLAGPGALFALIGAAFGAASVAHLPGDFLRPFVLVMLVLVAVYTFVKKDFGAGKDSRAVGSSRDVWAVCGIGLVIGFYDGFFGPGTGSFMIFLLVRFVGLDFLHASATSKVLNVATNLAALAYFSTSVEVLWKLGLLMAACNLVGALSGSALAIRHGAGFVRKIFLGVVVALICKMSYDLFVQ